MIYSMRILGCAALVMAATIGSTLAVEPSAANPASAAPPTNNPQAINTVPLPNPLQEKLTKLGYAQGESVQKIQNYRVDGWNYIDDKHIMIYAGPSVRYLISTLITCSDLASAERIGFSSTASSLTKLDKLVVRGAGGMRRDCPIDSMYQLNSLKKSR